MLHMIVCVKQIFNPEAPASSFRIDPAGGRMIPAPGVESVISPYDEQAVEAALRIKEAQGGKITAISLGAGLVRNVVKKPLSMGADELVLLEDGSFAGGDSWSTAYALAKAIKKIEKYDLIFCGRQAADWDSGQVGLGIAELLGLPSISLVKKVDVMEGKARVERVTGEGYEVVEVSLPALITVSNELGEARLPDIKGINRAARKQPVVWKPTDIGLDLSHVGAAGRRVRVVKLFQSIREGKCEMIGGETLEEAGANLALRLREVKLL